jgi:hypothetical protein
MAEEKKPEKKDAPPAPPKDPFVEIISWFLFAVFILYLLNGFIRVLSSFNFSTYGWKGLTPQGLILSRTNPISSLLNPVGARVITSGKVTVFDAPSGKEIGTQDMNAEGRIIQGPVNIKGQNYWYVDFDSGKDGWVKEEDIRAVKETITPLSDKPSMVDKSVVANKNITVYDEPAGNKIGTKPKGSRGTVIEGPLVREGVKYWHVSFSDGTDGWVKEDGLSYLEVKKTPLEKSNPTQGDRVAVSKKYTAVYAEPGNNQTQEQSQDAEGKIIEGPIQKDGVTYWKVLFDDGTTGWVNENDLDKVVYKTTEISDIPSVVGGRVRVSQDGAPLYAVIGGPEVATERKGERGKIIEGPLVREGVKYWHVSLNNGDDGWIEERYLEYIEDVRPGIVDRIIMFIWSLIHVAKYLLWILVVVCGWLIWYATKEIRKLLENEKASLYPQVPADDVLNINPRWQSIETHIESQNENDWRLAIIDADIMLDELLDNLSVTGETIGDKLKRVEKSDFNTIDNAWEAHKVRNQIAHEGQNFLLTAREARRIIELYRSVFEEFKII